MLTMKRSNVNADFFVQYIDWNGVATLSGHGENGYHVH